MNEDKNVNSYQHHFVHNVLTLINENVKND